VTWFYGSIVLHGLTAVVLAGSPRARTRPETGAYLSQPLITLPSEQTGGFVCDTGDPLARWLSDWISQPKRSDNLRKLSASSTDERHLFVIVAGLGDVPFQVTDLLIRNGAHPPTIPLILPPEVTHVWVMSTWSAGLGFRWSPSGQWQTFEKLIATWLGSA
jgi:hypothetical protein